MRSMPPRARDLDQTLDQPRAREQRGHVVRFRPPDGRPAQLLAAATIRAATAARTYSFPDIAGEINVALSALAHASSDNDSEAARAFGAGAAQLKLLEGRLSLLEPSACGFAQLDAALDRLAAASGPIKRRLLTAAAFVVNADGVLLPGEIELFRAMATSLDVPLPALPV